ncbi:hypothetical protein IFM89_030638 [Coptis chinensis]|uniref:Uncharacterized protein n=1 Tax=Coptis chinensis TaxID=261450 RepID=A0A835HKZ8_9MAGN|nr:hypothetical protein IFM89_030638 [Coptis chinensis]
MVFHSPSSSSSSSSSSEEEEEEETLPPQTTPQPQPPPHPQPTSPPLMSSSTKSQKPLHNFSLPYLKWGNNQRSRNTPPPPHNNNNRSSPSASSEPESDDGSDKKRKVVKSTNLVIRIPKPNNVKTEPTEAETITTAIVTEEPVSKPWNLRPRKGVVKNNNEMSSNGVKSGGEIEEKLKESHVIEKKEQEQKMMAMPKSLRLRGLIENENNVVEKKEKPKLFVTLLREEIEVDYFAWTGLKPPRRPKKRNRTVQKQMDNLSPGFWLPSTITADSYNVPEDPAKKWYGCEWALRFFFVKSGRVYIETSIGGACWKKLVELEVALKKLNRSQIPSAQTPRSRPRVARDECSYSHSKGHWKKDCPHKNNRDKGLLPNPTRGPQQIRNSSGTVPSIPQRSTAAFTSTSSIPETDQSSTSRIEV